MRPSLSSYLVIVCVAALVTVLTVPLFRVISVARGYMDEPDERRSHEMPTPILGGGAMYLGFIVSFGFAWYSGWFDAVFTASTEPLAIVLAATMAYGVGLLDDIRQLSAPAKTSGLVLVGSVLFAGGVSIIWFRIPFFDLLLLSLDLSFLLTVLWVLGLANAVNIIDGLDGLAAGIVAIGAGAFFLYAIELSRVELLLAGNVGPLVAAALLGVCVGFLPWNAHPARIFMGDGGSLLLGAMMAAATMAVGGRTSAPFSGQTFFFYAPLVIPFVILGVPILDTAFAIIRRASRRQGLATADKDHLHHRLIRMGHGHRRAVMVLWAWTALLSGFVLWPVYNEGSGDAIVPAGVVGLAALLYISLQPGFGSSPDRRQGDRRSASASDPTSTEIEPDGEGSADIDITDVTGERRRTGRRRGEQATATVVPLVVDRDGDSRPKKAGSRRAARRLTNRRHAG